MSARRRRLALALVVLVLAVLAGCSALPGDRSDTGERLGYEDGYAADDPLAVTTDDGFNDSERRAVLARTMARVEAIRGLEFAGDVSVRVISRAEYRDTNRWSGDDSPPTPRDAFEEQVWEAPFLVGEPTTVDEAFGTVYGSSVRGYYSNGEIVIVSDSSTPSIDTRTLAHELTHALQDQQLTLAHATHTRDSRLGRNGLVEGDANYVEARYAERCGGAWSCLPVPGRSPDTSRPDALDEGVLSVLVQPYVDGPGLVGRLRERGGWTAVDDAYDRVPESSEQVIHPGRYPDETPVAVSVPDRSSGAWERFDVDTEHETLGEAGVYTMLYDNGAVDAGTHRRYNYTHPLSAGRGGDALVPYTNGSAGGYVWRLAWDTGRDAREFLEGYRDVLRAHGATRGGDARQNATDGEVWVVPSSDPFADAVRVTATGTTVTIVNAPTVAQLDDVHAEAS